MKSNVKLFAEVANNINIGQYRVVNDGDHVIVTSIDKDGLKIQVFHSTHLVTLAESMNCSCYIKYINGFCTLVVF